MMKASEDKDVMLADDDFDDFDIFETAVKEISESTVVRHAKDGGVLFVMLNEAIPDLLFLDITMPGKDGISCLLEIRKNPKFHNMPVIMFTGHKRSDYITNSYENGANFY